ncbi:FUSC family protein [Halobacillus massiliensis]|uniref:FUSC family protein n=1 Tax=Halobacillus massiliensis TaxID=1926286 RepID=UPI0009E5A424|nr:aromatic acid exporter family protein [Halobacillus massiliensis]
MNIGARMLKTGIAVTLSLLLCHAFNFTTTGFAAIAAFLAIQPSVYRSWKHLLDQIQANVIGALFAFGTLYLLGNHPVVTGIIVILLIGINSRLGVENVGLSVVTAIAILEIQDPHVFQFGMERFLSVMVGIVSAVLINMIFLPPKYEERLLSHIETTGEQLSMLLRSLVFGELEKEAYREAKESAEINIEKAEKLFDFYRDEFNRLFRNAPYSRAKKLVLFKQMIMILKKELEVIDHFEHQSSALLYVSDGLKDDIQEFLYALTNYEEKIFMKYERKIKRSYSDDLHDKIEEQKIRLLSHLSKTTPDRITDLEDVKKHSYLFALVSSLSHLSDELEKLDILVERYHKYE